MLKRYFIQICLIVLFALAQTGIMTHAISHLHEDLQTSQSNPSDENTVEAQCGQCLSHAQADDGDITAPVQFIANQAEQPRISVNTGLPALHHSQTFCARAPPQKPQLLA